MKSKQFLLEIERVRRPLEAWRRTRKHRERIPEALWRAMGRLAKTYGISAVSHALRVEFYGLKRRVAENQVARPPALVEPAFVEVNPLSFCREAGCRVELEDRAGGKMTLRFEPGQAADALALAQAFWRRGA